MADDNIILIPRIQTRDIRYQTRGDESSGIANLRIRVTADIPPFAIEVRGKELAQKVAEAMAEKLRKLFAEGRDARGRPLRAISPETIERRWRRMRQSEESESRAERFKVRGGPNRSKPYRTVDTETPFHETGIAAENVVVTFKGTESGSPTWLVSFASGGKGRGLVLDDGRGARLWAVEHYGPEALGDIPVGVDAEIERIAEDHLAAVISAGGGVLSIARQLHAVASEAGEVIEEGAEGGDG